MEVSSEMIEAIVFDFNGVIIDDEPIHARLISELAEREGLPIPGGDPVEAFLGLRDEECFARMLHEAGREAADDEIERLVSVKDARYLEVIKKTGIPIFEGVADFISAASKKWPLAVASGALTDEIKYVLKAEGLSEYFSVVVGANETANGKPAPDIYLLALNKLNRLLNTSIEASHCVAIEDSNAGMASARAAGMIVVGLCTSLPVEKIDDADLILPDLNKLTPETLTQHLAGLGSLTNAEAKG